MTVFPNGSEDCSLLNTGLRNSYMFQTLSLVYKQVRSTKNNFKLINLFARKFLVVHRCANINGFLCLLPPKSCRNCVFLALKQTPNPSEAIDVPYMTLSRYFKRGMIKKFNIRIKPILYESRKIHPCNHCLSYIDEETGKFDPMHNTVHVNEKWFFMTRKNVRVYLTPDEYNDEEKEGYQTRGNKRWI